MKSQWIYGIILGTLASLVYLPAQAAEGLAQPATPAQASKDSAIATKKIGATAMETTTTPKTQSTMIKLPSGLEYEIVSAGTGKKPSRNDTVTVDYEGTLLNGQVFDSSYKRGQPASFPVSGVIAGWQEALQLMNTGATWKLKIPPQLAYGSAGAGGLIGPNETLLFKVHLISIQ